MSAQTMQEVFAPIEAKYKARVMEATWGHLAPKKNKTYKGRIVYAIGIFGDDGLNPTALFCEFEGLDDSPWFYDALTNFMSKQKGEGGRVYEFVGWFRNYSFKGAIRLLLNANTDRRKL